MFSYTVDADIELHLLVQKHAEAWFQLVDENRDHFRKWLGWLDDFKTLEDSQTFIQIGLNQFAANAGLKAGVWYQGKLVGGVSFQEIDWNNGFAIIGGCLSKHYEGRGIITRALTALINHAFHELKLNRVEARSATSNHKSRAIPVRLGFRHEGCIRDSLWLYDHFVDEEIYSIIAYEWFNRKKPV